jgi:hypothetical protein
MDPRQDAGQHRNLNNSFMTKVPCQGQPALEASRSRANIDRSAGHPSQMQDAEGHSPQPQISTLTYSGPPTQHREDDSRRQMEQTALAPE